jgi:AraC-like DNA-binding protein
VLTAARALTQTMLSPLEVRFRHPAPADVTAHRAFFGAPVSFGCELDELAFTLEQLALPLPKADLQLGEYLRRTASDALSARGSQEDLESKLRELLARDLQSGVCDVRAVARRLATSERTLRRRLEEKGLTFRDVLDATRRDLAKGYLRDRRIPLSEVTFMLGFSEPSAFHRAFRRWTGMTARAWRDRHGA